MSFQSQRGSPDGPISSPNGRPLHVLGAARISDPNKQQVQSLDDQEASYRRWLDRRVAGPYRLKMIAGSGSGERLDRKDLKTIRRIIRSGKCDLVICEDLGRIVRRIHAMLICELCEDKGVRLIAINDQVDTAREDWRMASIFASMRHEQHNRDLSARIQRSLRNRFLLGYVLRPFPFCYCVPEGAKHDSEVTKDEKYASVIDGIVSRLEQRWNYSEVADWLNDQSVPTNPHSRSRSWAGKMVKALVFNPVLSGTREFNNKVSKRINKTGRRRSVAAHPEDLLVRECPHLAFLDKDRHARLKKVLITANEHYTVGRLSGDDERKGRAKKRTRWPGQHIVCGICGWPYVYGGHGQKTHLMCSGARSHACWNGITCDGPLAAKNMSAAIFEAIAAIPDFDPMLIEAVRREADESAQARHSRVDEVKRELSRTDREITNILAAIRTSGGTTTLFEELRRLEARKAELTMELERLGRIPRQEVALPSMEQLRSAAMEAMRELAPHSYEFGRYMRRLVNQIVVYPYRLVDGGHIVLRASFTLSMAGLVHSANRLPSVDQATKVGLLVNLFNPPERVQFREQVMALRAVKVPERRAAAQLGITTTNAQRAAALHRQMLAMGISDPYVPVISPPDDYSKLRRHKHPRYQFRPNPDWVPEGG